jgi:SAM-dependent methyltransferase
VKESEIRNASLHDQYLDMVKADALSYFDDPNRCEDLNCPACSSDQSVFEFEKFGFKYDLCNHCGTLFVNPRPKLEYLEDFYINSPSSRFWIEEFFKPVAEARREKIFRPRAEHVARLIDLSGEVVVGDIGAGFGLFLEELSKINPSVKSVAIEPSPEMAEICRAKDFEVLEFIIEKIEGHDGRFDMLCSFELFEHLHTPRSMIASAFKLLKPGGSFLLTTLNCRGFDIQLMWEKSKSVFPPHHLNFCNLESLSSLLQDVGFEVIQAETPGVLDWDIIEGNLKREQFSTDRFWTLVAEHSTDECKQELQSWITKNKLSSHMRILARKPINE